MTDQGRLRTEVEPYIDSFYKQFPLFRRSRQEAVLYILRAFEDAVRLPGAATLGYGNLDKYLGARKVHTAVPWVLRWVWDECTPSTSEIRGFNWDIYREAAEIFEAASSYDLLVKCFTLCSRGYFAFELNPESKHVKFFFASKQDERREESRMHYYLEQETPKVMRPTLEFLGKNSPIVLTILPHYIYKVDELSVRYDVSWDLQGIFKQWAVHIAGQLRFDVPGSLAVGDVTLSEFTLFWQSLLYTCSLHSVVHALADGAVGTKYGAISTSVLTLSRKELSAQCEVFQLSAKSTNVLIDMLTYNPREKFWDPFWQPLIEIEAEKFAIAPGLILGSSPQRNFLTLLTKTEEGNKLYNAISGEKEAKQIDEMEQLLQIGRHITKRRVKVRREDGSLLTDIDLMVFDPHTQFLLILQAKWLMHPDHITEVLSRDEEIQKALRKVKRAETRVRQLGAAWVSQVTGSKLPTDGMRVGSVLVNKEFIPSGWVHEEHVPVVDFAYLRDVVKSGGNLASVFEKCLGFDRFLQENHPSSLRFEEITLGEYSFEIPVLEPFEGPR